MSEDQDEPKPKKQSATERLIAVEERQGKLALILEAVINNASMKNRAEIQKMLTEL